MKLQNICEKIIARYAFPMIMGNDFAIKLIKNVPDKFFFNDKYMNGIDLDPFENMFSDVPELCDSFLSSYPNWDFDIKFEPIDFNQADYESSKFTYGNSSGWPATFADIMS